MALYPIQFGLMNTLIRSVFKSKLTLIPLAVIIALILFRFKGLLVAATVNGQPISRIAVLQLLEKEGGKSVLDTLVTNSLVLQEAQKEHVTATSAEITSQLNQISNNLKTQGQDLNTALSAQGMTQNDLKDQIKLQVLVQKMAAKNITVTDKEAQDYFNQNQSTYAKGTNFADVKSSIITQLTQQKTSDAINAWIANLKSKAKVSYFVGY